MNNVINQFAKSVLIRLGLRAAASAADAGIHKKILEGQVIVLCPPLHIVYIIIYI